MGTHKWTPPQEGEPESKERKGKMYKLCANHKGWVVHDPEDCNFDVKERLKIEIWQRSPTCLNTRSRRTPTRK